MSDPKINACHVDESGGMADTTPDLLAEARGRLSGTRLGTSVHRETDKDLAVIARLADEVERLREWKRLHSADVRSIRAEQGELEDERDAAHLEADQIRDRVESLTAERDAVLALRDAALAHCEKLTATLDRVRKLADKPPGTGLTETDTGWMLAIPLGYLRNALDGETEQ